MDVMSVLDAVRGAFSARPMPAHTVDASPADTEEVEAAASLKGVSWQGVPGWFLEEHPDCVYGLSAEAFAYYLPAILCQVADGSRRHAVCWNLIELLDRPMGQALWDDFFLLRWGRLGKPELDALDAWLSWYGEQVDDFERDVIGAARSSVRALLDRLAAGEDAFGQAMPSGTGL